MRSFLELLNMARSSQMLEESEPIINFWNNKKSNIRNKVNHSMLLGSAVNKVDSLHNENTEFEM